MKKFKFAFTKLMYAVFSLGLALCGVGIGFSVYRIVSGAITDAYDWIGVCVMLFACAFLIALVLSMFISTRYVIKGDCLYLRFGFIPNKYELSSINSVHLFEGAGKLVLYFKNNGYTAVVIQKEQFQAFIQAITEQNPKIGFSYSTAEEEEQFKKKK